MMTLEYIISRSRRLLAGLVLAGGAVAAAPAQLSTGVAENFNGGWLFSLTADSVAPSAAAFDDSSWRRLDQ